MPLSSSTRCDSNATRASKSPSGRACFRRDAAWLRSASRVVCGGDDALIGLIRGECREWALAVGGGISAPLSVGDATLGNGAAFVTALGGNAVLGDDTLRRCLYNLRLRQ